MVRNDVQVTRREATTAELVRGSSWDDGVLCMRMHTE